MKDLKNLVVKAIKTTINTLLTAIYYRVDNALPNLSHQFFLGRYCPAYLSRLVDVSDWVQVCVLLDLHPITPSTNIFVCVGTKKHIATSRLRAGHLEEFKLFNFLEKEDEKYLFA